MSLDSENSKSLERALRKEELKRQKAELLNDRCYEILLKLKDVSNESNIRYNSNSFADYFGVSVITISRDIKSLSDLDLIEYDRSLKSFKIKTDIDQIYSRKTEENIALVASLKGVLQQYKNTPLYSKVEKLILLLEPKVAKNTEIFSRIAVPPTIEYAINTTNWELICRAMKDNHKIAFHYEGINSDKTTERIVQPYQLLLDEGSAYLFCYNEQKKTDLLYAVNRIKGLRILPQTFTLPEDYDFSSRTGGGLLGAFKGNKTEKIKIQLWQAAAQWHKDHKLAVDQTYKELEDSIVITFTTSQVFKVLTKVLSWGALAKPLAPKSFVDSWKASIQKMSELAKD
ncbi:MAG: WYL domain-containing protein [Treponema sp.]|nr:WYL domain-containing protein [Treponema sp.]